MRDADFIQSLAIARDDRLRGLLPTHATQMDEPRRGGDGADADALTVDGRWRAAVNAGSIVSFVAGVTPRAKSDVLFSTQLAQRAATARHDRHEATEAWYKVYVAVLQACGWVGEGFAFTNRGASAGDLNMQKSALDVMAAIATGNQLAILVKALDALKALAEDNGAIRLFELQAVAELSGNFQLGAVQQADNGALSLALGGFHFKSTDHRKRILFWNWGSEQLSFWTAAQKMTLNEDHYASVRQAVMAKIANDAGDYIAGLEI